MTDVTYALPSEDHETCSTLPPGVISVPDPDTFLLPSLRIRLIHPVAELLLGIFYTRDSSPAAGDGPMWIP